MSQRSDHPEEILRVARRAAQELLKDSTTMGRPTHPDIETLIAYQEERLEESRADEVATHVGACARCAAELRDLESFDENEEVGRSSGAVSVEEDWQRFQERLARSAALRDSGVLSGDREFHKSGTMTPIWARPIGRGLLAASLLIAVIGAAAWLVGRTEPRAAPDKVTASVEFKQPYLVDLMAQGELIERSGVGRTLEPPAGTDLMVFRLLLGDLTAYSSYFAEIQNSASEIVWTHEHLVRQPNGVFVVLVARQTLPPGDYRLLLHAGESGAEQLVASYEFAMNSTD